MTPIDLGSYKSIYLKTAKEYINNMLSSCVKLEDNVLDTEALNTLHIASHSLKSQSQVMGFNDTANLSAAIEQISSSILKQERQINSDLISVLKESVEELSLCLSQIEKKNKESDLEQIIKTLEDAETSSA